MGRQRLVRKSHRGSAMFHLFHLGPLVLDERRLWLLSGVNEAGGFFHPLVGRDIPSGLAALSARHGPENLRVELDLEGAAAQFGIRSEPLPEHARIPRAVLAFAFLTSPRLFRRPGAVAALLEACALFETAGPWNRFRSGEPFDMLLIKRWRSWQREFVVRGAGTEAHGLELYEKPGSVERTVPKPSSLLVTFDSGPPWAADAVRTAYGLHALPTVVRLKPGSLRQPEPRELLELSAALRCAALLAEEEATPEHGAHVELAADRFELTALATPPPLGRDRPRVTVSLAGRNALCPCGSGRKFKRCHLGMSGNPAVGNA
jgi:SEC-C motif